MQGEQRHAHFSCLRKKLIAATFTRRLCGTSLGLLLLGHILEGKVAESTSDEDEEVNADTDAGAVAVARVGAGGGRGGSLGGRVTGL